MSGGNLAKFHLGALDRVRERARGLLGSWVLSGRATCNHGAGAARARVQSLFPFFFSRRTLTADAPWTHSHPDLLPQPTRVVVHAELVGRDGGLGQQGKFLIRTTASNYIITVVYQGMVTHHILSEQGNGLPFKVNGAPASDECTTLELVVAFLRNANPNWPLG